MNIVEKTFHFKNNLAERQYTDRFVIHHTGTGSVDMDASAEQIHDWHLSSYAGIGYHFVVRKDGTIERGRPEWAIGSHAYGSNHDSIGIHLSGEYEIYYPTDAQIESTAELLAELCEYYDVPIDRNHILGHFEVDPDGKRGTSCPGRNLFARLDEIVEKAKNYHGETAPADEPSTDFDIDVVATLARKYESSGNPACVADNTGDLGGISYGLYQFASNVGTVDEFVKWLCKYPDPALANYGKVLAQYNVNSADFIEQWQELGTVDAGNFGRLQDEYIKLKYYDVAAKKLADRYYTVNKHTNAIKAVILSRSVQNGASGCADLFEIACSKMGYPNLSYIDDKRFDKDLINAIYDYLIVECDLSEPDRNGIWRSPDDFCHGSKNIILALRSRFVRERADALALLTN